jgi:hypothetical protein
MRPCGSDRSRTARRAVELRIGERPTLSLFDPTVIEGSLLRMSEPNAVFFPLPFPPPRYVMPLLSGSQLQAERGKSVFHVGKRSGLVLFDGEEGAASPFDNPLVNSFR